MLYSLYVTLYCVHSFTTEQDEENQTRSNNQAVFSNMVAGPWWSTSSDQLKQPACTKKREKKIAIYNRFKS